jgi:hypothetical protein
VTGVEFASVEPQNVEPPLAHRARAEAASKLKIHLVEQQLRTVKQRRKLAEMQAASLRKWELAQAQAQEENARQQQMQASAAAEKEHASSTRVARAKQAAAAKTRNGRLGPSQESKLREAIAAAASHAAAETLLEELLLSATAAAAADEAGLQPASIARLERAGREEHTKQLAARKQRRAAAARVEATRKAQIERDRVARKTMSQQERERRSARRARVHEHMEARRLMEQRWAAAKAEKGTLPTVDQERNRKNDPTRTTVAASTGYKLTSQASLMERAAELIEDLLQRCEEDTVENISEEERVQMERNADNIDFDMLNTTGSLLTLIKYTILGSVRPVICRQLERIANSENELPEPAQHCALLRCLVDIAQDDTSSVEALNALHAAVSWPARLQQQEQDAEELQVLREKLQTIARERKALEEQTDVPA